ncbi:WAP, Kazal, immunoglobulin, Kunitz and NTR domain-containing protein 1 [Epinephelus fuscoguttatus]|uniref:WAP, Kazal, immunoglobulin, Kunitz and NTR domain-containing protein 1 n=1 Tax=Epinephelus fuscoguttatus TaxID=293821 RepID=UPI0020D1278E|nr:WAP, Kazal, immunoglobulin, Kunitz and NTR domain-containing protein 1 [Epinephelus fuscoguttatus]
MFCPVFFSSCYLPGPLSSPCVTHTWSPSLPESCLCSLGVPVCSFLSYLALSGSGPISRSQPTIRARPAPEHQLVVKGEEGRELRVVVNTNDPDYEHIYSIEAYDDPLDELLYFTPTANQSDGEVVKDETVKTVKAEPSKSATAVVKKAATADGQRAAKVKAPLRAVKPKTVRSKRRVKGEAPADLCLLPMEEGSCGRYTLRWYFNSQVQACRPFIYSGCEGNDNRFLHLEECEELCLGEVKGSRPLKTAR